LVDNPEGKKYLQEVGVDGRIIENCILGGCERDSVGSE
jgi:hypothetical protein